MIEALRPSTLGEILDRTANMYRGRFLVFLGIAGMPAAVILACAAAMILFFTWLGTQGNAAGPMVVGVASIFLLGLGTLIFLPVCIAAMALGTGALNHAAAAAVENEAITIRGAYKAAWKRGWRYIGLLVLEGLILVVAPGIVWTIVIFAFAIAKVSSGSTPTQAGAAAGGLVLLLIGAMGLYALFMLLMLCLAFPACVVENVGPLAAMKRAISLSKGTRGRILVLYILGMVLRWGVSMALMIPVILIVTLIPGLDTPQRSQVIGSVMLVVIYGGSFLVRGLTKPIYTIAQMLFYYDQRIRKEGFDIERLMRQAGMVETPMVAPEAAPWMPPVQSWGNALRSTSVPAPVDPVAGGTAAGAPPESGTAGEVLDATQVARTEELRPDALPSAPGEPA
jgi:hypothetical protein